jgi:transcriptional regulator GlxA family with amidase domain
VTLYPALEVEPQATVAAFDARHPDGADYVIVPAMSRDDDPAALQWIRRQAAKGAIVIGVCAGAKVVGNAGLLDGKRGTTHWYYLEALRDDHPAMHYVEDRRLAVGHRLGGRAAADLRLRPGRHDATARRGTRTRRRLAAGPRPRRPVRHAAPATSGILPSRTMTT